MLESELEIHPIRLKQYMIDNPNWKKDDHFLDKLEEFVKESAYLKRFDITNCISDIMCYAIKYVMYPKEQETSWIVILQYRVADLQKKFEDPYKRLAVDQCFIDSIFNQYIGFEKERYFKEYGILGLNDFDNITNTQFIKGLIINYAYTDECKEYIRRYINE